jgi:hypothetical protein
LPRAAPTSGRASTRAAVAGNYTRIRIGAEGGIVALGIFFCVRPLSIAACGQATHCSAECQRAYCVDYMLLHRAHGSSKEAHRLPASCVTIGSLRDHPSPGTVHCLSKTYTLDRERQQGARRGVDVWLCVPSESLATAALLLARPEEIQELVAPRLRIRTPHLDEVAAEGAVE